MKRDYIFTFITQFVILLSGVLLFRLSVDYFGEKGFSEYALSKRTASFLIPVLSMGFGVGIPRFIAYAHASREETNPDAPFIIALLINTIVLILFCIIFNVFAKTCSALCFGSSDYVNLIFPITVMIFGNTLHSLIYSYYRGRLMMTKANVLQLLNMGLLPPMIFFMDLGNLERTLLYTGIMWTVVSFSFLLLIFPKLRISRVSDTIISSNRVVSYSLMRVPGDFAISSLMALPAFVTAYKVGTIEGGYVSFGISVMSMIGYFFAPISTILLPKASQMMAGKRYGELKKHLRIMLLASIGICIPGIVLLDVFSHQIILLYLGTNSHELNSIVRIISIGIVPYVMYILLRSVIDARYQKPINTFNIIASLIIFFLLFLLSMLLHAGQLYFIILGFIISMAYLGIASFITVQSIFREA